MRVCFCLWTANHPPRFHLCVPSAGGRAQLHWKKVKLIRKSISNWRNLTIIPHRKDYDLKSLAKTSKSMQQKRLTTKVRRIEFVVIFYSILLGAFVSYFIYTCSWASPLYIYLLIAILLVFFCDVHFDFFCVMSCCLDQIPRTRSRLVKQSSNETTDSSKPYQLFKHNLKHSHTEGLSVAFALLSKGLFAFAQSS